MQNSYACTSPIVISHIHLPLYLFLHLTPAHVIAKAQGLAILSVFKAGFMITARGGSGIVIARLADGSKCVLFDFLSDRFIFSVHVYLLGEVRRLYTS